jgi:hypothetical protein
MMCLLYAINASCLLCVGVIQVLRGMCIMDSDIFKRHLREFYPLITKLICCDQVCPTLQKHGSFVFRCKIKPSILSYMQLVPLSFGIIVFNTPFLDNVNLLDGNNLATKSNKSFFLN